MATRDTAGAIQAMKMAQSYLRDFMNQDKIYEKIAVLKQVAHYIKLAEEKDPDVEVPSVDGSAYVNDTVNILSGVALFYEAQISSTSAKVFDEDSEKYTTHTI